MSGFPGVTGPRRKARPRLAPPWPELETVPVLARGNPGVERSLTLVLQWAHGRIPFSDIGLSERADVPMPVAMRACSLAWEAGWIRKLGDAVPSGRLFVGTLK